MPQSHTAVQQPAFAYQKGAAESLGMGLHAGAPHYRAYVGPPEDYDLIAASSFGLLTRLGLRQHHALLDIGCGSLRVGRLLIPYLNADRYVGIEPNAWLVDAGIAREVGRDLTLIKRPRFHHTTHARGLEPDARFDFALAQSIFSHCGVDLLLGWLCDIAPRLTEDGMLVATFVESAQVRTDAGWFYPECIGYPEGAVAALAAYAGLEMHTLDWPHPRQRWAVFARPGVAERRVPEELRRIVAQV
jgi:hypothetical protein